MTTMIADWLVNNSDEIAIAGCLLLPVVIVLIPTLALVRGWVRERRAVAALDLVSTEGCGLRRRGRARTTPRTTKEDIRLLGFADGMIEAARVRLIIVREDARAAKVAAGVEHLRTAQAVRQVRATAESLRRSEAAKRGWERRRAAAVQHTSRGAGQSEGLRDAAA